MVKFDDTVCCKIIEALEKGDSIDGACGYAGIHRSTFYAWYNEGATKKSGKKKQFHDNVDKAKSSATDFYENVIYEAAKSGKWQAGAWWLERRRADLYNKPDKVMVNPKQDLSEFVADKDKQDEILDDI
jgi:hypothetical protein